MSYILCFRCVIFLNLVVRSWVCDFGYWGSVVGRIFGLYWDVLFGGSFLIIILLWERLLVLSCRISLVGDVDDRVVCGVMFLGFDVVLDE